jgi:CHC2-type zinc finger protein
MKQQQKEAAHPFTNAQLNIQKTSGNDIAVAAGVNNNSNIQETKRAKKSTLSPFHLPGRNPSFSVSEGDGLFLVASTLQPREGSAPLSKRALRNVGETYGPPELCAWRVVPGVFWIQTTEPQFSRKLEKREDARRVEISGVNHFRRIFEIRGTWRKIRRLIDRYLVSAGDRFSGDLRAQGASKDGWSIHHSGKFEMSDFTDLRHKIDEAKRRLPMPGLLTKLGLGEHAKKSAHCPFPGHEDKHKSFSVFQGNDGFWHWNCFAGCGDGDEIMFLRKLKGCSLTDAMNLFLDMAGFPSDVPRKSHEYPKSREFPQSHESPKSPECFVSPVYPMSKGQELEKELEALTASNACTEQNTARKRRWQLLRDLRAVQVRLGRELNNPRADADFV